MPTDRKPLHRAHRSRLDSDQELDLWLGPSHRGSAFESEAQRQWAWTQHRDRVMAVWGKHGKRPWAWWRYESGRAHPGDREASTLYEMGVLAPEERAELERWWRGQFERAQARARLLALSRPWPLPRRRTRAAGALQMGRRPA